ncbi:MAG: hypothetical protein VW226_13880, partial [Rhodospirillaceae bacterium]
FTLGLLLFAYRALLRLVHYELKGRMRRKEYVSLFMQRIKVLRFRKAWWCFAAILSVHKL